MEWLSSFRMQTFKRFFRVVMSIIFILMQQVLVVFFGLLLLSSGHTVLAVAVWLLAFPMVYVNIKTYKYVTRFGFINFITMNADTSEIDIPKDKRWYNL